MSLKHNNPDYLYKETTADIIAYIEKLTADIDHYERIIAGLYVYKSKLNEHLYYKHINDHSDPNNPNDPLLNEYFKEYDEYQKEMDARLAKPETEPTHKPTFMTEVDIDELLKTEPATEPVTEPATKAVLGRLLTPDEFNELLKTEPATVTMTGTLHTTDIDEFLKKAELLKGDKK